MRDFDGNLLQRMRLGVLVPAPSLPPPPRRTQRSLRDFQLIISVVITVLVATAFIINALPSAGIFFAPLRLPDTWGTVFLLPLVLQIVLAALSLRTIVDPMWTMVVLLYAFICLGLVGWSIANVLISIVVYVPTLSGFTAGYTGVGLYFVLMILMLLLALEFAYIAALAPLIAGNRERRTLSKREAASRTWVVLWTLLVFILTGIFFVLDAEPSSRVLIDFWPTPLFGATAATVWLLPQLVLYPVALALLVAEPGLPEELKLVQALLGVDIIAGLLALVGLISTIVALVNYVPTAVPFTPTLAGVVVALIFAVVPFGVNVFIVVWAWDMKRRMTPFQRL